MYLLIKPGNTFSSCVTGANLAKHWTSRVLWLYSTGSIGSGPSTMSVSCGCTSLELEDCAAMVKWHSEMIVTTTLGDDSNTAHLSKNCNDRHWNTGLTITWSMKTCQMSHLMIWIPSHWSVDIPNAKGHTATLGMTAPNKPVRPISKGQHSNSKNPNGFNIYAIKSLHMVKS